MAFDFPSSPTVGQTFTPVAGTTYTYNGVGWVLAGTSVDVSTPQCGRLTYVSATALSFKPFNGDRIKINGTILAIPSAGIAGLANTGVFVNGVAEQSLAANTTYYVYAFNNSGTVTGDFSTTGHATSTTAGNVGTEIKSGDDTRTLIGIVRAAGGPPGQFFDVEAGARLVRSWFNRSRQTVSVLVSQSTTSTTPVGVGGINQFMCFAGEAVHAIASGYFTIASGAPTVALYVWVDGAQFPNQVTGLTVVANPYGYSTSAVAATQALSEGYHLGQVAMNISGGAVAVDYIGGITITVG